MPSTALLPLAPIRHVYVKIHPAIETKDVPLSVIRAKCHEVGVDVELTKSLTVTLHC